ncbi:4'-phosphopantetheinyl transferase superfamily protein [Dehalobacter sp. DCM]|uniref:4'-phosphopantetheinyl transferase family protein n=1 Tax=Dehalobacter sp. DCM TaxID=2907827 RepID=UPI003081A534|nr:4'-phosphopantetheinyl transferase superfamily protein [Dehalobacter sp. DCM]
MITLFANQINSVEDKDIHFYLEYVSQEKKERLRRFVKKEDVKRSLLGEILLRNIVMQYGIPNNAIDIRLDKNRKPFIPALNGFYFNISHSNEWVICATGTRPVGADIEWIRQVDLDTVKYVFSPEEYSTYLKLDESERPDYFFRLWTIKESYLKALGVGLNGDLKSITPQIESGIITTSTEETAYFKNYELDRNYWVTVCGFEREFDPEIRCVHIQIADFVI